MAKPSPTVIAGYVQALKPYPPFASLALEQLERLVRAAELAYYAPGQAILEPGERAPAHLYIVKQGTVEGRRGKPSTDVQTYRWTHGPGEMFPLSAMVAQRASTSVFRAEGDVFCFLLPERAFRDLLAQSPVFNDFCSRRLMHLLDLSKQQLQAAYVAEGTSELGMARRLGEIMRRDPLACAPSTPLREALAAMDAHKVGSIVTVDPEGRPVGILTHHDVIGRVVLPGTDLAAPVSEVTSGPVLTLPTEAIAADAALLMAGKGIRHVAIEREGRLVGVISERDLFSLQRLSLRQISGSIVRARSVDALAQLAGDIRRLSRNLVAQGVSARQLTQFISSLNDQLTTRLLGVVGATHDLAGLRWCWLALGSEGRHEQTIATDQDNGIVFAADGDPQPARERLLPFAREMNHALDACGFPLCKGEIMAGNPKWCLSLDEWQAAFARWIDQGSPEALLNASIFFDFRALAGEAELAHALRAFVSERARANPRFLKQMSDNALRNRPPSLRFAELLPGGAESIDLKMHGTVPLVDAARIFALAAGVSATNTVERLGEAGPMVGIPEEERTGWADAFQYLQMLRLRAQHARLERGEGGGTPNEIRLADLSQVDRRLLKVTLGAVREVQSRLELDYPG